MSQRFSAGRVLVSNGDMSAWYVKTSEQAQSNPQFQIEGMDIFGADGGNPTLCPAQPATIWSVIREGVLEGDDRERAGRRRLLGSALRQQGADVRRLRRRGHPLHGQERRLRPERPGQLGGEQRLDKVSGCHASFNAIHRSDDEAKTWTRIDDDQHQWGWTCVALTGDPRIHGRVHLATNGRGVQYGEPGLMPEREGRPP